MKWKRGLGMACFLLPLCFSWHRDRKRMWSFWTASVTYRMLNHVLKCHIYIFFGHLRGWWLHHFPGQPVLIPDHSFSREIFPNIRFNPSLKQLEAIASHPVTSYLGEETNVHLTTISFQVVVESAIRSPLSLLFSRLNNPSSFSRSS